MNAATTPRARTALADLVERFAKAEIAPYVTAWDEAGEFPRSLYQRAADLGLLGIGYPQSLGGGDEGDSPTPMAVKLDMWIALARYGTSGGMFASLFSHNIAMPPVLACGSDAVKNEVLPAVLRGEKMSALCSPSRAVAPTSQRCAPTPCWTESTTSSTVKKPSSPPACAPTGSPWPCAPMYSAVRAASPCYSSPQLV